MVKVKEIPPIWKATIKGTHLGSIVCGMTHNGLISVYFDGNIESTNELPVNQGTSPAEVDQRLKDVLQQIQLYLKGQLKEFSIPLDLSYCTEFQRQVLLEVLKIPYGQVMTYGQIAEHVGGSKHVRAVGGAVGSNPIPIIIPCHRVVSSVGHLRGYSGWGGIRTKAWLLQLEGQQLIAE